MSETATRTEWVEFRTGDTSVFVGKDFGNTTEMRFRMISKKDRAPVEISWSLNGHTMREIATRWFPDPAPGLQGKS